MIGARRAARGMNMARILVISMISLSRFREGGAAMLAAQITNHQKAMFGLSEIRPLVRKRLRVVVVSYVIFARANREGEIRP